MTARLQWLLAAVVAVVVLAAGLAYAAAKKPSYTSDASLVLAPQKGTRPDTIANLVGSFTASGTTGTYVELISSSDTLARAGVGGVSVTARAIPDARAIQVSTSGPQDLVTPALARILSVSLARESEIGDVWQLHVLQSPSAAAAAGPKRTTLILATVILAALAALFVIVVARRLRLALGGAGAGDLPGELAPGGGALPQPNTGLPGGEADGSESTVSFQLESFRYIEASATTVLLQVVGYWRADPARLLEDPVLLLHDGRLMHPLSSVADPDKRAPIASSEAPLWRGSYAAPIEIFGRQKRAALRAGPGVVVGLPQPREQQILASSASTRTGPAAGSGANERLSGEGTEDALDTAPGRESPPAGDGPDGGERSRVSGDDDAPEAADRDRDPDGHPSDSEAQDVETSSLVGEGGADHLVAERDTAGGRGADGF